MSQIASNACFLHMHTYRNTCTYRDLLHRQLQFSAFNSYYQWLTIYVQVGSSCVSLTSLPTLQRNSDPTCIHATVVTVQSVDLQGSVANYTHSVFIWPAVYLGIGVADNVKSNSWWLVLHKDKLWFWISIFHQFWSETPLLYGSFGSACWKCEKQFQMWGLAEKTEGIPKQGFSLTSKTV